MHSNKVKVIDNKIIRVSQCGIARNSWSSGQRGGFRSFNFSTMKEEMSMKYLTKILIFIIIIFIYNLLLALVFFFFFFFFMCHTRFWASAFTIEISLSGGIFSQGCFPFFSLCLPQSSIRKLISSKRISFSVFIFLIFYKIKRTRCGFVVKHVKIILGWIWWCFTLLVKHHQIQPNIILTCFTTNPHRVRLIL